MRHDDLAARLLVALDQRDDVALAGVLNPKARLLVDTGDDTGGEVRGRARVIRALRERLATHPDAALEAAHVNGGPGLALRRRDGEVIGVLCLEVGEVDEVGGVGEAGKVGEVGEVGDVRAGAPRVEALWLTTAPGKLAHWNRRRPDID